MIKIIRIFGIAMLLLAVSSVAWANVKGVGTTETTPTRKSTITPKPTRPPLNYAPHKGACYISITSKVTRTTSAPNKGLMTSDEIIKALKSGKSVIFSEAGSFVSTATTPASIPTKGQIIRNEIISGIKSGKRTDVKLSVPVKSTITPTSTPNKGLMTSDEIIKALKSDKSVTFGND